MVDIRLQVLGLDQYPVCPGLLYITRFDNSFHFMQAFLKQSQADLS